MWGFFIPAPLLLARKRAKGRKGAYPEEERLMPWSLGGWGDLWIKCTPTFTVS